jgi:hypothetical protein
MPVKSILNIVAENVSAVIASFNTKVAEPKDAGRAPPVLNVGTTGGDS